MTQTFIPGDIFGVPLPDGSRALGQVLGPEPGALNSVGCAFFAAVAALPNSIRGDFSPIAALLVTPDLLNSGKWPVMSNAPPVLDPEDRPYEQYRAQGWVGAKVVGSANVAEFLAAFHCLTPWDAWHDPKYLDTLLLPGVSRPEGALLRGGG